VGEAVEKSEVKTLVGFFELRVDMYSLRGQAPAAVAIRCRRLGAEGDLR
jgi:hypothetical protein